MPSVEQMQGYLRQAIAHERDVVAVPPFTIFFARQSTELYFNYAIPDAPVGGDLSGALAELRAAFAARVRRPRFEFIESYAPALPAALVAAGFAEESRLQLLACTPATYQPAAERARLRVIALDRGSPIEALRESLDTNARGFNPDAEPTSLAEAADFRGRIADGRLFTAYLDGQAAGAGMYTTPIDGLCELVGIATLEPFRRQGVATALTSYAARVAFEHGVGTAFLSAADAQAGRVYERVGFRPFATMLSFVG